MSNNPFMDYQQQMMKAWSDNMEKAMENEQFQKMMDMMPGADFYKKAMESTMPNMQQLWKNMTNGVPTVDTYWNTMANMMPKMDNFWGMMPNMQSSWEQFSKMMPEPEKFMEMFPYKIPGMDVFSKLFDMWKDLGNPAAFMQDYQEKYMDLMSDVMKGFLPDGVQQVIGKPMEFMNTFIEYYQKSMAPWMQIDQDIMERLAAGDLTAYYDFFKDFEGKYDATFGKYFNMMELGLNRESNQDYMQAINAYYRAMTATGMLVAIIVNTSAQTMNQISDRLQSDLAEGKVPTTFRDFYNIWYSVTEGAFEELLATDEFSKAFGEYADKYSQYMIAMNKVYERMLSNLPIPTNTDMKSLYKTVYDLRKDVRDLKKELAELKTK